MYVILQGTLLVLIAHVICYYFWKTRFYWLAKLHRKDNKAIRKLLSFSKIDRMGMCGLFINSSTVYKLNNNMGHHIYLFCRCFLNEGCQIKMKMHKHSLSPLHKLRGKTQ